MSEARLIIGDTRDVTATIPDGSVDLIITSPPFLALRSYLPADHVDKHREIGSEANPAAFLDVLLDLTTEWRRVLAPHGSICVELGDTYSGSGGAGGDYNDGGLREGQPTFKANPGRSVRHQAEGYTQGISARATQDQLPKKGSGWPLAKSLCGIPHLYHLSLAYGRNLLNPAHTIEPWRVRNVVAWCLDGDTVVYARTPKGEGPARLLHLTQNFQPGQWELWDGERWTPVLGWSTSEASDAVEIEFRNGERISATRDHEWPTQRGLVRTDDLNVGDVVRHVRLPEPDRAEPELLPAGDIGWLVGTFLADGSFDSRNRIQIAGHRNESSMRVNRLRRLAESFDGTATEHEVGQGNEGVVIVRSPVLTAVIRRYVGGTSARNKHLRPPCWRRGNDFLSAVLDGYLMGDGHYDAKNDRWRLGFTDNAWLARDLRVTCARLGYRCRIKRLPRAADPRGGKFAGTASFYWRGEIRYQTVRDLAPMGEIVALRASKRRRFFDIGVEGEPHLFALGSGILTHNCRPNPPVGALGDKFRPATSYLTIACVSGRRYFDLDAVREPWGERSARNIGYSTLDRKALDGPDVDLARRSRNMPRTADTGGGAPPLDWWELPTAPYAGAHYAAFPKALITRPILAMCPIKVCTICGRPSERIVGPPEYHQSSNAHSSGRAPGDVAARSWDSSDKSKNQNFELRDGGVVRVAPTLGWTDCGHNAWRPGHILDPFVGSGTTLAVATGMGRDCTGIDLDPRNADLARDRVGMFLEVEDHTGTPAA